MPVAGVLPLAASNPGEPAAVPPGDPLSSPPEPVGVVGGLGGMVRPGGSTTDLSRPSRRGEMFYPGEMVATRYRVLNLVGRGGMGEVYRAEDVRLGQDVALKFLPRELATDPASVGRMLAEARLARLVTHPNVCRVHDVGDVDGHVFLSMEFIEGENLSGLIKRIGHLPEVKALQVAHQVAAGLSAAHDRGVIHRDLKPANVMLDSAGNAKIADFGLSGLTDQVAKPGHRAGTPAYMAPEQLRGEGASVASDLYSLGLVLYEVFTGRAVFRPKTMAELEELHEKPIPEPSLIKPDIDPSIERAIMWCLAREPSERPPSARALASALPGGGLLQAAVLAGRTPSPEEVAAAGRTERTVPWRALLVLAAMGLWVVAGVVLARTQTLMGRVPLPKPIDAMADRARMILRDAAGYTDPEVDSASAYDLYEELLSEFARRDDSLGRWSRLERGRPAAVDFWYREGTMPLVTAGREQRVSTLDPAPGTPGVVTVRLDPMGRLRELIIPREPRDHGAEPLPPGPESGPNWAALFEAAGLDLARFEEVPPARVPPVYADQRRAWTGLYPEAPQERVRVEASSFQGRLASFRIVETAWARASSYIDTRPSWLTQAGRWIEVGLGYVTVIGGAALAWRNTRLRRGDKAGATRVATIVFGVTLLAYLLSADHVADVGVTIGTAVRGVWWSLPTAAAFWVMYLGFEPYVRRIWPEMLISWTRLLGGGWRDPLVGLSVLMGCLAGSIFFGIILIDRMSPAWVGVAPKVPFFPDARIVDAINGSAKGAGLMLDRVLEAAWYGFVVTMTLVLLRLVVRSRAGAAVALGTIQAVAWYAMSGGSPVSWIFWGLAASIVVVTLVRLGLLALVAGGLAYQLLASFPIALSPGNATLGPGLVGLGLVAGMALASAWVAAGLARPGPESTAMDGVGRSM